MSRDHEGEPVLIDTFDRIARDLRVSLTDRCNLRCTYCMPEEGLDWLAKPELLTADEIVRLIHVAVTQLVDKPNHGVHVLLAQFEGKVAHALHGRAVGEQADFR